MAWLVVAPPPDRFRPVRTEWCASEEQVRISVTDAGCLHLLLWEAKQLLVELDSAVAEADAEEQQAADEAALVRRARLRLIVNDAG